MQSLNDNQPATKGDLTASEQRLGKRMDTIEHQLGTMEHQLGTVEKNIQEDIYRIGEIVATKDDLQQGLDSTRGAIVTDIKEHIDKKIAELKGDLVSRQNKTVEAVMRFAAVFERTQNLSAVDREDMVLVKRLLEARP